MKNWRLQVVKLSYPSVSPDQSQKLSATSKNTDKTPAEDSRMSSIAESTQAPTSSSFDPTQKSGSMHLPLKEPLLDRKSESGEKDSRIAESNSCPDTSPSSDVFLDRNRDFVEQLHSQNTEIEHISDARKRASKLDPLIYSQISSFKEGKTNFEDLKVSMELLWLSGARGLLKLDGKTLKTHLQNSELSASQTQDILKIVHRSRNQTMPLDTVKSKVFHGTPCYITGIEIDSKKELGLGLVHNPTGGRLARTRSVFLSTPEQTLSALEAKTISRLTRYARSYSLGKSTRGAKNKLELMDHLERLKPQGRASFSSGGQSGKGDIKLKFSDQNGGPLDKKTVLEMIDRIQENPQDMDVKSKEFIMEGLLSYWTEAISDSRIFERRALPKLPIPEKLSLDITEFDEGRDETLGNIILEKSLLSAVIDELYNTTLEKLYAESLPITGIVNKSVVPTIFSFKDHVTTNNTHKIQNKTLTYRDTPLPFDRNLQGVGFESIEDWSTYFLTAYLRGEPFPPAEQVSIKSEYTGMAEKRAYYDKTEMNKAHTQFEQFISKWLTEEGPSATDLVGQFDHTNPEHISIARDINEALRATSGQLVPTITRNIPPLDRISETAKELKPRIL